jgi:phage baseplate assembly protein W
MKSFDIPFSIIGGSVGSTDNYDRIIRNQVIDALTTNQNERVMHPDWGCDVQSLLFDPSDELDRQDTASQVRDRLIQFVPSAFIKSASVKIGETPNLVYIDIAYKASSYVSTSTVSVGLDIASSTGSTK